MLRTHPLAATWLGALILAALALAGYEGALRARGIRPSVTDDRELWTTERLRASNNPRAFVLCGASRIQLGFDPAVAHRAEPSFDYVQLAIDGTNAVASFRDLADDPTFDGTVVFSVLPAVFSRRVWEDQMPWVGRRAAGWTVNDDLNRGLRLMCQEHLAVFAPDADAARVATGIGKAGGVPVQRTLLRADRFRTVDYSDLPRADFAADRFERDKAGLLCAPHGPDYDQWLRDVADVEAMTRRIQERGGRVIILHDHLGGAYKAAYEEAWPRDRYWDAIVARSSATCIHADDVPELAALDCPDGSHIDSPDAPVFTRALLGAIRRRGVLR